ncbi:bola protein [Fusarium flagelliforme]|uniref:Bola protein n=1 Tax=Fusarium flagelliforme TaxID=2675880 RepID=A0A395M4K8_9HYPO|nr:bola protein [Fusarium flagelliforme]
MSQITDESLREAIKARLEATHVEVTDMSGQYLSLSTPRTPPSRSRCRTPKANLAIIAGGCGQAFNSLIVSSQFQGLNSLKRHRLVNAALKEEIAIIHAWTAKCQTPEEYAKANEATDAQAQA